MDTKRAVLIVDDDPNLLKTLSDILKTEGFSTMPVTRGAAALERVRQEAPSVALIDLKLDDMSGLEVMEEIRKISPKTQCIVITGHASQESAIEAVNLGAYSYLQKPYDMDHLLVTVRRIMEKMEADEALRESEERMELALRGGNLGTWDWNLRTGEVTFNERWVSMLGYALDQIEPRLSAWKKLVHPDDLRGVEEILNAHLEGARDSYETEHRLRHKSGAWIWVLDKGRVIERDADGRPLRACGTHLDITERKRLEDELRQRTQALGNRVRELNCLYAISKLIEQPDVTPEQIFQGTVDVIPSSWQYPRVTTARITLGDRVYRTVNFRESRWRQAAEIVVHGTPIGRIEVYYLDEKPTSVEGPFLREERNLINTIAEELGKTVQRIRLEEEKVELKKQLHQAQKMEAVGTLAAGIAHDFNNALTVIYAHADMAKTRTVDEDLLKSLRGVEDAVEQATGMTRSLLTFSQKFPAHKRPIDLCAAIDKATQLLRRTFPASIELLLETQCEPAPWVNADPTQLQQIVLNLAVNARDAMPSGGVLRFSVLPPAADAASVEPVSTGSDLPVENARLTSYARLIVTDTGTGISPEIQSRIFEPFFTTKSRGHGTGLGLAIIHGIVEDHGGRVHVHSEAGAGTTFTISFPCVSPNSTDAEVARESGRTCGHGELILLAEDEYQVRAILAATLASLGYEVVQVADGDALLECFERHRSRFRLLVLDVDLPKRNGLDCLRVIRAKGVSTPAIVISGNVDAEADDQLDEHTILLPKPFQMAEMGRIVGNMLAVHGSKEVAV